MPLNPLPTSLGAPEAILVSAGEGQRQPPWLRAGATVPGERDPIRLARALGAWRRDEVDLRPLLPAVLATDPVASPARWANAPRVGPGALLWVPEEAFAGRWAEEGSSLLSAWGDGARIERWSGGELPWLVLLVSDEPPSRLARRLRRLSRDPAMEGRMLAVWSLAGPVRPDLPAALLAEGRLAAVGVAASTLVARREAVSELALFSAAIENPLDAGLRVEAMPGPFLWFY